MYEFHQKEFESKGVDMRKTHLDIVLNVDVFYRVEAVTVKELLSLIVGE